MGVFDSLLVQHSLKHKHHGTLVIVTETLLQSAVPVVRSAIRNAVRKNLPVVLCALDKPADVYLHGLSCETVRVIDAVPSFESTSTSSRLELDSADGPKQLLESIKAATLRHKGRCMVVIDSAQSLIDRGLDLVYSLVKQVVSSLSPDGLLLLPYLEVSSDSPSRQQVETMLLSSQVSPSTVNFVLHPAASLETLASTYGLVIDPPDLRLPELLRSFRKRLHGDPFARPVEADHDDERIRLNDLTKRGVVLEYTVRGPQLGKEKKVVYWGIEAIALDASGDLRNAPMEDMVTVKRPPVPTAPSTTDADPTGMPLSFNLSLTESQRQAKDSVVLPYLPKAGAGTVDYEPDEGDDFDDDDPDEDLEI